MVWVVPRGVGSSQREIPELSIDGLLADVEAVADDLGWSSLDLWGEWTGNFAAIAYAARHPERVARIVLWSASANWAFVKPGTVEAMLGLIRSRWWLARRAMSDLSYPTGPVELYEWFVSMLGESISPEMMSRYFQFQAQTDLTELLPKVHSPVLLLHRRGDRVTPIAAGRMMDALLPDSRFLELEGDIASPYFGDTSFVQDVRKFLDDGPRLAANARTDMTRRETEVLRLIAAGNSNRQIAEDLCISINTADRHVSNILTKIAASNRAEAASYAVRSGIAS